MKEFDVIENYLRHGDYPIGIAKDQIYEENVEITASSMKASRIIGRKPTLHLCCMIAPSMAVFHMSFRCRLRTSIPTGHQGKEDHGGRAASVQQQTAVHLPACGVIAIALTYHFSRGDSVEKLYFCTSALHMFATRMDQHENDTV